MSAPVGGWNTRDAIADMPITDAVVMDNWFPGTSKITTRRGYSSHATGMTGNVDSLLIYNGLASNKMFAAADSKIYDVTSAGAVGAAALSGLANNRWQHLNFGSSGTQYLFMCNGADTPRTYNGAAWANTTITGPTVANLIWCNAFKERLFVGEINSLSFWYGGARAIGGAFAQFFLEGVAHLGGYVMAMGTWTRDGGAGPEDYAVFVTSEGEAIVYAGIDPASASTWSLVGNYRIGKPIGRRCLIEAAGDLLIITETGFLPMSALQTDKSQQPQIAVSQQIDKQFADAVVAYGANFGWQPFIYPAGQWLLVNIPTSAATLHQYVFNTITRAPCRFTGMNARCWGLLNGVAYFGGTDGKVYIADRGTSDNGTSIAADVVPAFTDFRDPSHIKLFALCRPILEVDGIVAIAHDLNIDYKIDTVASFVSAGDVSGGVWDSATWDSGVWGGDEVNAEWDGVSGIGRAASLRSRVSTQTTRASIIAVDYLYEVGHFV
ncbi:MAG: hypothetical protein FJX78_06195 [Armatimonadetes bacterium]|nr:hypothetical protein [Armatimonadota bacterium]